MPVGVGKGAAIVGRIWEADVAKKPKRSTEHRLPVCNSVTRREGGAGGAAGGSRARQGAPRVRQGGVGDSMGTGRGTTGAAVVAAGSACSLGAGGTMGGAGALPAQLVKQEAMDATGR